MTSDELERLEAELRELLKSRSKIDARITEVEHEIAEYKRKFEPEPGQLFKLEPLPDLLDSVSDTASIVRKSSTLDDKYQLFLSLFAGRPDVHARRFERGDGTSRKYPDKILF
ncbi:MAG: hypothetical protein LBL23_09125 [Coriobacteriales bacterium]|nr:hypothetical protein [Coriobacteriales bacterium]